MVPGVIGIGWWIYWPTYHRHHLLAVAEKAIESNNLSLAKESLETLFKEKAGSQWEFGQEAHVQLLYARVLRRLGRGPDAWAPLRAAVEGGLPEPEGRREYALLEAEDDFPLAEKSLRRVLEESPNDVEVLQALAEGYAKNQHWQESENAYTRWLQVQPEQVNIIMGRGHARLELRRLEQAEADFRHVLATSPNHFQARLSLAQCLLSDFKVEEAEAELGRCHQLLPARPEPLVGLAACALERADLDKAQTQIKEALALDPASTPALTLLGIFHLRRQRYDLAIPVFERVILLNPRDKQGHLGLAQALAKNGQLEKAKKHEILFNELEKAQPSGLNRGL